MTNVGGTREDRSLPHTLMVNQQGRRFVNESMNYNDVCAAFGTKLNPVNDPAWLIFDEQGASKYLLLNMKVPPPGTTRDWVVQAGSLDELAAALEIEATQLRATIERFNGFARDGRDLDFGRGETLWDREWGDPDHGPNPALGTVEVPPFYAVRVFPGALATKGGLRVDDHARVLSAAGSRPIPGLFAAGNVSSGAIPNAYPGAGATLAAAMTFGYLAGRSALGLEAPDAPEAVTTKAGA
jgi:3-oxosteroid 1-dehydrogenase